MQRPVIAFCGPHNCGKDEACLFLVQRTSLRYPGSLSSVILPYAARKLGLSEADAWDRRHRDHEVWNQTAYELREQDAAFLVRSMRERGELISGIRARSEFLAARAEGLIQLAVWVDRDVPNDPTLEYGPELCDVVIDNRGDLQAYRARLLALASVLPGFVSSPAMELS